MANAGSLLVALLVLRRRPRWDGFLILVFAAWYGAGRFLEDFFRIDDTVALGLSGSQLSALTLVVVAGGWLRSEEHTSELQSLMRNSYAVFCLKKKTREAQIAAYTRSSQRRYQQR